MDIEVYQALNKIANNQPSLIRQYLNNYKWGDFAKDAIPGGIVFLLSRLLGGGVGLSALLGLGTSAAVAGGRYWNSPYRKNTSTTVPPPPKSVQPRYIDDGYEAAKAAAPYIVTHDQAKEMNQQINALDDGLNRNIIEERQVDDRVDREIEERRRQAELRDNTPYAEASRNVAAASGLPPTKRGATPPTIQAFAQYYDSKRPVTPADMQRFREFHNKVINEKNRLKNNPGSQPRQSGYTVFKCR